MNESHCLSSISPDWHHTTCGHQGENPKSNHGQTMTEKTQVDGRLYFQYGITVSQVGLIFTGWSLSYALAAPIAGWISDKVCPASYCSHQ